MDFRIKVSYQAVVVTALTPVGDAELIFHGDGTVYATLYHATYRGRDFGRGNDHFHGVGIRTLCTWRAREGAEECGRSGMHTHGLDWAGWSHAPRTYRAAILDTLWQAVTEAIASIPNLLAQAKVIRLARSIHETEEREEQLRQELDVTAMQLSLMYSDLTDVLDAHAGELTVVPPPGSPAAATVPAGGGC